ncbi:MAG: glycosyltransferase family 4 protein [Christiangramia sp.]|uniref:glycosyltransferase family 4 protein n=1 Tax=Christiangramia sp. TaxID=1931228 RepID=UPI003241D694
MKILHLIQREQNRGAETFTVQLAKHQTALGHSVRIISLFPKKSDLPFEIINIGARESRRFYDFEAWRNLNGFIKTFKPDIIQANAGDTLKYASFSKFFFKWDTPVIFRNASQISSYIKSPFQKFVNIILLKNIDFVASVSKISEVDFLNVFPTFKNRIRHIPIGIETNSHVRTIESFSKNDCNIIHVGGFTFEKNHISLIEIFQVILKHLPASKLHLIGDGPLKGEIEELVHKKGISNKVNFYGFVSNPLDYIQSGDILVLPSIIEGLPGVILESMYCKTPVVAYNVGGISEIINPGTGDLVMKDDIDTFAKTVVRVLNDTPKSQIENAYDLVTNHFTNEVIAKRFISFYLEVIDNNNG